MVLIQLVKIFIWRIDNAGSQAFTNILKQKYKDDPAKLEHLINENRKPSVLEIITNNDDDIKFNIKKIDYILLLLIIIK